MATARKTKRLLAVELLLAGRKVDARVLHVRNSNGQVDRNAADRVHNLGERLKVYFGIVRDVDVCQLGNGLDHSGCAAIAVCGVNLLLSVFSQVNHSISGDGNQGDLLVLRIYASQNDSVGAEVCVGITPVLCASLVLIHAQKQHVERVGWCNLYQRGLQVCVQALAKF